MHPMLRNVLVSTLVVFVAVASQFTAQQSSSFPLEEMTVAQLQEAMVAGRYTSRRLVELYTERINVDRSQRSNASVGHRAEP